MISRPAFAEDAGERNHSDDRLFGFRLRAAYACPGDKGEAIERAAGTGVSDDEKSFANALPDTVNRWVKQGAEAFNHGVMTFGMIKMCRATK